MSCEIIVSITVPQAHFIDKYDTFLQQACIDLFIELTTLFSSPEIHKAPLKS